MFGPVGAAGTFAGAVVVAFVAGAVGLAEAAAAVPLNATAVERMVW